MEQTQWGTEVKAIKDYLTSYNAPEEMIITEQIKYIEKNGGPDLSGVKDALVSLCEKRKTDQVDNSQAPLDDYLTPYDLGKFVGKSGKKMNEILWNNAMQVFVGVNRWEPTEKGEDYCIKVIECRHHIDESNHKYTLRWHPSVLDVIDY